VDKVAGEKELTIATSFEGPVSIPFPYTMQWFAYIWPRSTLVYVLSLLPHPQPRRPV